MNCKTILVVDDDEDIRESLTRALEFGGLDALETLKNAFRHR